MKSLPKTLPLAVPALIMGVALAAPLVAPKEEARRLEVLFFGAPTENGPHHDPITRYRVLKKGLGTEGINLSYSENPSETFSSETLANYDAVLMYANWNQHEPMPAGQLQALTEYVNGGGGFVPVHCASACYGGSPEFIKLVGARFASHGGEEFQVKNVKPGHPILQGLDGYKAWDETYVHDNHGDDREILQTRDNEPWTWTRQQGGGRVFYTAGGHDHRVWDLKPFQELLRNGIYWAVGPEKYQLVKNLELPELKQEKVSMPGYREREEITMAQVPLPPEESIKLAQVPAGMELSLFASEPDIVNPIFVAWDERGRAFVIETIDYPNNLQANNIGHDRITICEDTDGDGRADKFTRFAEKLSIPTALVFANGGVICTNGSDMLFLKDTNGDDQADVREVLFTGFSMGDTHAGVSNLRWGLDGWIYATVGYSGFNNQIGGENFRFGQAVFRFLPDGSEMDFIQNTTNNTWGLGFTEEFDIVGSTANGNPSFYVSLPKAAYDLAGLDQPRTPRADDNPLFNPMSWDVRQVDQFDRFTAAAGHAIYTARRFPEEYHNQMAFVCGPTGKLAANFEMTRDGAGWKAVQSPNNLFTSADAWSSPVCAEVGPDGAVWLCDWYNLIIQHNPTPSRQSAGVDARNGKGNAYETPLRDKQHGRIYRVYPKGSADDANPGLDPADAKSLISGLDHPNMFWRSHAQRLIMEKGDASLAPELVRLIKTGEYAQPHAFYALASLGTIDAELLQSALKSTSPALQRAAIANADPAELKTAFVVDGTIKAEGRALAEVLAGLAAGAADPEIGAALYGLAADMESKLFDDPVLRDAWQIAARRQADGVMAAAAAAGNTGTVEREPENLLPNAGFAETGNGVPAGWTDIRYYGGARGDAVKVEASGQGRTDASSLQISADRAADFGVAVTARVEPGTRYRLSGWIKTEGVRPNGDGPGALMNVHGGQRTRGVKGDSDWTEVSVEFDSGGDRQAVIHCLFGGYGGATGTAWFDDVSLVKVGSSNTLAGALESLAAFQDKSGQPAEVISRKFEPDPEIHARGLEVYNKTCIACHGVDGKGVPGAFPPLVGSDWLTGDPALPTKIVLHGLQGPIKVGAEEFNSVMAPLGPMLNDQEVADVLTFVRQSWTNDAAPVEASAVKAVRDEFSGRTDMWTAPALGR